MTGRTLGVAVIVWPFASALLLGLHRAGRALHNRLTRRSNAMVHTRTHVYVTVANPHLVCDLCRQPALRWHNDDKCGCDETFWNEPCGCQRAGVTSVCPSWSPVDGCQCKEHLGRVDHAQPNGGEQR